jgi:hypothetical protein
MKHSFLAVLVLASAATGSVAQTPRQRIGLHGSISYGAIGTPTWSSPDGARGDIILLGCEADTGEEVTVAAYLSYRNVKQLTEPPSIEGIGDWRGVPVNEFGARWGYRSTNYRTALASVRWRQQGERASRTVQLFLPYEVLELGRGPYQVAYLIRVFVNGRLVDEFYTDEHRFVTNAGSRLREFDYHCKAMMGDGPVLCGFRLLGTNDPPDAAWPVGETDVQAPTPAVVE